MRIQSRPGKRSASSGVQISPVGRRLTNTVFKGCPSPIFARTMCWPLGVQKLPCCSPAPLREVDTMRRYIYIHGSPESVAMGKPGSIGCIRMRNQDVVELFELVPPGTQVSIAA